MKVGDLIVGANLTAGVAVVLSRLESFEVYNETGEMGPGWVVLKGEEIDYIGDHELADWKIVND